MIDLSSLSVVRIRAGLTAKEFSALELTNAYLERIDRLNPTLNAFLTVTPDLAREQAKRVDGLVARGAKLPPLAGVPTALKDNILVRGERATGGSKILDAYLAAYDATVVARLKAAGAIILGKTNLDEFAMGSSTENSGYGPTRNPWDANRVPGGSSGGSAAAVAASLSLVALGSDTGGSIRQPASFCGVVGLKPTYGRVSRYGLMAMASSLDQIGPVARSVEDAAAVFDVVRGLDPRDGTSVARPALKPSWPASLKGRTVGLPKEYFGGGTDSRVAAVIQAAVRELKKLGATVKEVSLPHTKYSLPVYYVTVTSEISSNLARYDGVRYGRAAPAATLAETYTKTRAEGFGAEAKRRIILGTFALSAGYVDKHYKQAQLVREKIRREYADVFSRVDCLVTPTTPTTAFRIGEKVDDPLTMYASDLLTVSGNIAGLCGISIPAGFVDSLPVGLQFLGPAFGEGTILDFAAAYERATDWHERAPTP